MQRLVLRVLLLTPFICDALAWGPSRPSVRLTPDLQGGADHGVYIAESPGKGMGVFAMRPIAARVAVGDYTGELISVAQHEARYGSGEGWTDEDEAWLASRRERDVNTSGDYVVGVTDELLIDAEDQDCSSWCRFINHDAAPNLALKVLPKGLTGKPRVWFVTLRPVSAGDELCFDYGPGYWDDDDGVETRHHVRIESELPPAPWSDLGRAAAAKAAAAKAAADGAAEGTAPAGSDANYTLEKPPIAGDAGGFGMLEAALLSDLEAWATQQKSLE